MKHFQGGERDSEALVLGGPIDHAESEYHRVQRVRAKKANLWQSAETTLPRLIISSYLLAPVEMIMLLRMKVRRRIRHRLRLLFASGIAGISSLCLHALQSDIKMIDIT